MRALRGARGGFGERARPYRAARPVYDRGPLSTRAVMRDTPAWAHVRGSGAAAKIRLPHHSPEWRNGRRRGLKIPRGQPRVSSTLTSGMHTAQRRRVYAKRAITHAITGAGAAGCLLAAAASRGLHGAGTVVQQAQATPRELEPRVVAVDAMPCKACHETIFNTFAQTAHFKTSAEATAQSIKGSFTEGHNLLRTRADGIYFKMERRKGAFYQTGVDSAQSRARTERIDLVVGSGRRGQSYLYWRTGLPSSAGADHQIDPLRPCSRLGRVESKDGADRSGGRVRQKRAILSLLEERPAVRIARVLSSRNRSVEIG